MPQLPSNVNYGTVVGQFVASVSDTNDPGYEPDSKAMEGTIVFTPSVSLVRNVTADPNPVTIVKTAITGILDDEGYLCTNQRDPITNRLRRGLSLVANDDEDLEPKDWNWVVTYKFKLDGWDIAGPPQHGLDVHTDEVVDLTEAIPVTVQAGVPIVRGPQGNPGDLVPSSNVVWEGAVDLQKYPTTHNVSLRGDVTSMTLPQVTQSPTSGTITLVVVQDSTGGRTITWPPNVLWPEGIKPQPTLGAGTISVFHLLWSGAQWLGLVGGRAFA